MFCESPKGYDLQHFPIYLTTEPFLSSTQNNIMCTWKRVCVCSHQMFAVVLGLGRFEVCAPCASLSRGWWVSHDLRGLGGGNGTKSCQRII